MLPGKKNALTVVRGGCYGADGYCDPPRRLDDELDPLRPTPPCRIRMSFLWTCTMETKLRTFAVDWLPRVARSG
jgi:hypothetical protein